MQQLALFTLPRLEIDEDQGADLVSKVALIGSDEEDRESSDEEDEEEMSELEFDSNPPEDCPWEDGTGMANRWMAEEYHLPQEETKHEELALMWVGREEVRKRRKKKEGIQKSKWLGFLGEI